MKTVSCIPCKICAAPSTGFHYGALTCEACKAFFRRVLKSGSGLSSLNCLDASVDSGSGGTDTVNSPSPVVSSSNGPSTSQAERSTKEAGCDLVTSNKKCPKCRFNRCLQIGMSPDASKIGRPTKGRLQEFRDEVHRFSENSLHPKTEPIRPIDSLDSSNKIDNGGFSLPQPSRRKVEAAHIKQERIAMTFNNRTRRRRRSKRGPRALAKVKSSEPAVFGGSTESFTQLYLGDNNVHPQIQFNDSILNDVSLTATRQPEEDDAFTLLETTSEGDLYTGGLSLAENSFADLMCTDSMPLSASSSNSSVEKLGITAVASNHSGSLKGFEVALANSGSEGSGCHSIDAKPPTPDNSDFTESADDILAPIRNFYEKNTNSRNRSDFIRVLRNLVKLCKKSNNIWMYASAEHWYKMSNLASSSSCTDPLPFDEDPLELFSKYVAEDVSPPQPSNSLDSRVWQVVQSSRYLFHLNTVPRKTGGDDSSASSFEHWWSQLMHVFEAQCVFLIAFVRNLPGFTEITDVHDRVQLTVNSIYPLILATLSLDFDVVRESPRTLWMSPETLKSVTNSFPSVKHHFLSFDQHFIDSGNAVKSANLTIVEFGFLCALTHFNASLPGLRNPKAVTRISEELMACAEAFIRQNFEDHCENGHNIVVKEEPSYENSSRQFFNNFSGNNTNNNSESVSDSRIKSLRQLVGYFRKANDVFNSVTADFLASFPSLIETCGEIFREMNAKMLSSPISSMTSAPNQRTSVFSFSEFSDGR